MSGRLRISLSAEPLLYILHGTETGNAEGLAFDAAATARTRGMKAKALSLDAFESEDLPLMQRAIFIVSTSGDGDMPYTAERFWDRLSAEGFPSLEGFHFAVLALGDSIYEDFCQAGKDIDEMLEERGATRVAERIDCDDEYALPSGQWIDRVLPLFAALPAPQQTATLRLREEQGRPWSDAEIAEKRILAAGEYEAVHYRLQLSEGLEDWQPGDSVAFGYRNDPDLVDQLLAELGFSGDERWEENGVPVADELAERRELRLLSREVIDAVAARAGESSPLAHLSDAESEQWRDEHDLLALLRRYPRARFSAHEWGSLLRPLRPRAYSLASLPDGNGIDLAVRTVSYRAHGRELLGVVSGGLSRRSAVGERLRVQHRPQKSFRLPDDPHADVVMVGPGVGVAPFRAFLQQRRARGDRGRSWLFQGIREQSVDHLYAEDFADWQRDGTLTRYDLCVSRARTGRAYVQHRMAAHGAELFGWLESGGYLYVCGDARRMAPAVHLAVRAAAIDATGSVEKGQAFVEMLRESERYRQDVY